MELPLVWQLLVCIACKGDLGCRRLLDEWLLAESCGGMGNVTHVRTVGFEIRS
jgi:hypothetical protein